MNKAENKWMKELGFVRDENAERRGAMYSNKSYGTYFYVHTYYVSILIPILRKERRRTEYFYTNLFGIKKNISIMDFKKIGSSEIIIPFKSNYRTKKFLSDIVEMYKDKREYEK